MSQGLCGGTAPRRGDGEQRRSRGAPAGEGDTGRAGGAGAPQALATGKASAEGAQPCRAPSKLCLGRRGPQVRSRVRGGAWRGRGLAGAGPAGPRGPRPCAQVPRRVGGSGRSGRRAAGAVWPARAVAGAAMPTNFTVVPVDARADGGQDEAAEPTEAPGAPEGREPDRPSRGERGRTCPPDKGGAGLRGSGGAPGRGGDWRKGVGLLPPHPVASPLRAPPGPQPPPAAPSPCPGPGPLPLQSPPPSLVAGRRIRAAPRAPGARGSPPPLPPPPRRARKHLVPALRVGQRGGVGGGRRPGVALETGEAPRENPRAPRGWCVRGRLPASSGLCSPGGGAKGRGSDKPLREPVLCARLGSPTCAHQQEGPQVPGGGRGGLPRRQGLRSGRGTPGPLCSGVHRSVALSLSLAGGAPPGPSESCSVQLRGGRSPEPPPLRSQLPLERGGVRTQPGSCSAPPSCAPGVSAARTGRSQLPALTGRGPGQRAQVLRDHCPGRKGHAPQGTLLGAAEGAVLMGCCTISQLGPAPPLQCPFPQGEAPAQLCSAFGEGLVATALWHRGLKPA